MSGSGLAYWIPLIARFSAGQVVILALNMVTGFLVLRFLSVEEYAVYILASLLQSLQSLGSDFALSQGVVSIGAPIREDKPAFGSLFRSALRLRKKLFMAVTPVVLGISYFILRDSESRLEVLVAATGLALLITWVQQRAELATAVLNVNHDSAGQIRAGTAVATTRLLLVTLLCSTVPYALTALLINLMGSALHAQLLWQRCGKHLGTEFHSERNYSRKLVAFAAPLLPGMAYYALQGQISTVLLAIAGATVAVAEVGALGRLGQIIAVLALLNGFFIQPYFARIQDRTRYAIRALQTIALMFTCFAVITVSVLTAPEVWLALLGPKYEGLTYEVVIVVIGAQLGVVGATLYTIVVASGRTEGQWLQIFLGLGAQLAYLMMVRIQGTREALILNLLPTATSMILQIGLLVYICISWKKGGQAA